MTRPPTTFFSLFLWIFFKGGGSFSSLSLDSFFPASESISFFLGKSAVSLTSDVRTLALAEWVSSTSDDAGLASEDEWVSSTSDNAGLALTDDWASLTSNTARSDWFTLGASRSSSSSSSLFGVRRPSSLFGVRRPSSLFGVRRSSSLFGVRRSSSLFGGRCPSSSSWLSSLQSCISCLAFSQPGLSRGPRRQTQNICWLTSSYQSQTLSQLILSRVAGFDVVHEGVDEWLLRGSGTHDFDVELLANLCQCWLCQHVR